MMRTFEYRIWQLYVDFAEVYINIIRFSVDCMGWAENVVRMENFVKKSRRDEDI
jgi:hypothetical protein